MDVPYRDNFSKKVVPKIVRAPRPWVRPQEAYAKCPQCGKDRGRRNPITTLCGECLLLLQRDLEARLNLPPEQT